MDIFDNNSGSYTLFYIHQLVVLGLAPRYITNIIKGEGVLRENHFVQFIFYPPQNKRRGTFELLFVFPIGWFILFIRILRGSRPQTPENN